MKYLLASSRSIASCYSPRRFLFFPSDPRGCVADEREKKKRKKKRRKARAPRSLDQALYFHRLIISQRYVKPPSRTPVALRAPSASVARGRSSSLQSARAERAVGLASFQAQSLRSLVVLHQPWALRGFAAVRVIFRTRMVLSRRACDVTMVLHPPGPCAGDWSIRALPARSRCESKITIIDRDRARHTGEKVFFFLFFFSGPSPSITARAARTAVVLFLGPSGGALFRVWVCWIILAAVPFSDGIVGYAKVLSIDRDFVLSRIKRNARILRTWLFQTLKFNIQSPRGTRRFDTLGVDINSLLINHVGLKVVSSGAMYGWYRDTYEIDTESIQRDFASHILPPIYDLREGIWQRT